MQSTVDGYSGVVVACRFCTTDRLPDWLYSQVTAHRFRRHGQHYEGSLAEGLKSM